MKYLLTFLLFISSYTDINEIARVNKVKKEAKEAYLNGDYQAAVEKYRFLVDSLNVVDDDIRLNLANAYYNVRDTAQAINGYSSLLTSKNKIVRSTAHQQMGVISSRNKKFDEALDHFKQALKADPTNEDARYNYELMKKILKEQEEQQQDQQNQEQEQQKQDQQQQKQDQQNQQKQDDQKQDQEEQKQQQEQQQNQDKEGEGEEEKQDQQQKEEEGEPEEEQKPEPQEGEEPEEKESEQQPSLSEKLEEMKISEEKAQMILEALRNKEIQYYQQNKRKASKRKDPKKPDW